MRPDRPRRLRFSIDLPINPSLSISPQYSSHKRDTYPKRMVGGWINLHKSQVNGWLAYVDTRVLAPAEPSHRGLEERRLDILG
jgi:hypothetical protein